MALIICPECGQQVSDKAEICPHCGIKIAGHVIAGQDAQYAPQQPAIQPQYTQQPVPQQTKQPIPQQPLQPTQQQPQQPAPQPKKTSWVTLFMCLLFASAACGVGAFYYIDAKNQREQGDYEDAMASNDTMVMQTYLARYADAPSAHRDSVKARMDGLNIEENEWHNARISGTRGALQAYLDAHPATSHRSEISHALDSIDYARTRRDNTTDAYKAYLKQHPDGAYATEAMQVVEDRQNTEVAPEDIAFARRACRLFFQAINAHSESKLLNTVTSVLSSFLGHRDATGDDVITFMNKLYKDDVTNLNWHILDDFKVEKVKADNGVNLKVQFDAVLKLERTDASKEHEAHYIIEGEITPEGRIAKLNMRKTKAAE